MKTAEEMYKISTTDLETLYGLHIVDDLGNISTISNAATFKMADKTPIFVGEILYAIEKHIKEHPPLIFKPDPCTLRVDDEFIVANVRGIKYASNDFVVKACEKVCKILSHLGYGLSGRYDQSHSFFVMW